MKLSKRQLMKSLLLLAGTPLYQRLITSGTAFTAYMAASEETQAVGSVTPYHPFGDDYDFGVAFRATAGFVTDGVLDDYNLAEAYPVNRKGFTHGWVSTTGLTKVDGSPAGFGGLGVDPRIAGGNINSNTGTQSYFRVDLPSPGLWSVEFGFGYPGISGSNRASFRGSIHDDTTLLYTLPPHVQEIGDGRVESPSNKQAGGAAGVGFPHPAAGFYQTWPSSHAAHQFTMTTSTFILRLGSTTNIGGISSVAYIHFRRMLPTPLPDKATWELQMLRMCRLWANTELPKVISYESPYHVGGGSPGISPNHLSFYDGTKVYVQLYQYTGEAKDLLAAQRHKIIYGDRFTEALKPPGQTQGLHAFATGLRMYYDTFADETAKMQALHIATNALGHLDAKAADPGPNGYAKALVNTVYIREAAYALTNKIEAARLGVVSPYIHVWRDLSLNHLNRLCVAHDEPGGWAGNSFLGLFYVPSFMVGLCMFALIEYIEYEREQSAARGASADTLCMGVIKASMDYLWEVAWIPNTGNFPQHQSFWYENTKPSGLTGTFPTLGQPMLNARGVPITGKIVSAAPVLNMEIAPAWAWYYHRTGDVTVRDQFDQIFAGGVVPYGVNLGTHLYHPAPGKGTNQNYQKSFQAVAWREAAPVTSSSFVPKTVSQAFMLGPDVQKRTARRNLGSVSGYKRGD